MKRSIHQSTHPFDACAFETFYHGSWKTMESLRIRAGAKTMLLVGDGDVFEENVPITNFRIRSRKATSSDCTCFLRPGVDVCVLSTCQLTEISSEGENLEPVWLDAKINSIERKPHMSECACHFYVNLYVTQGPLGVTKKILCKDVIMLQIDQIFILQKLERNPSNNEHHRWHLSEDCSSLQECKLFPGKFSCDVSWLLVASVHKKIVVDVRSIQNRIVYQIVETDCDKHSPSSEGNSKAVNFKFENGISVPIIVPFTIGKQTCCDQNEDEPLSCSELMGLRRSTRRCVKPEFYSGCDDLLDSDIDLSWTGTHKTNRQDNEGDGRVHSFKRENFSCQGKIKSRDVKSMVSNLEDHQAPLAHQRKHISQPSITAVKGETGQMVHEEDSLATHIPGKFSKGRCSNPREHQPPLVLQRKHKLQPSTTPVKGETVEMVDEDSRDTRIPGMFSRGGCSIPRERQPPLAHQIKHKSQPSITVKDETDEMVDEDGEIGPRYIHINGTPNVQRNGTLEIDYLEGDGDSKGKSSHNKLQRKRDYSVFSVHETLGNAGTCKRRSCSASMYAEIIKKCMENIKPSVNKEQPQAIDNWNDFRAAKFLNMRDSGDAPLADEEEDPEIQELWKEMELSTYLLEDNKGSNVAEVPQDTSLHCGHVCRHEYKLNEEIGILCQLCGFVITEIKDVSPTFWKFGNWISNKGPCNGENSEQNPDASVELFDLFRTPAAPNMPLSEGENNVWVLIPDLKRKLRIHQKRAFEFLWRNIAGSLIPTLMDPTVKDTGGCVISHSPGAGKTMLIIAFLVSYLKLFPGSRPLVLAPKTALYTWSKETIKWEIPFPVYQIHGSRTDRSEVFRKELEISPEPGFPKLDRDVLRDLDCMEKIQKWLDHPSVLLMGYSSFLTLTREDSKVAYKRYLCKLLRQSPGILILDEGHNPRSSKSRMRKVLMKVETRLRILLSGTLFQNNFGEYFNTLSLARPSFVNDVLKMLDPKYKTRKKGGKTHSFIENRARRLFIDKIAERIDSSGEERRHGLNLLRDLTSGFIDVYDGGSSDNLPGLRCYTLMMKSTGKQQELLIKLLNQAHNYRGFPMEKEFLITLLAIHPWLLKTTPASSRFFNKKELEKCKLEPKFSSKVRFVMSLMSHCIMRKEKVLIFCRNISPINLFVNLFSSSYGWRKGEEVLVLQGEMELSERGVAMDKFEQMEGVSKVMLASITACGEGISLTAASRVILLDSEWNPSKTKQAIARAFRPGQKKMVYVYQLLASGTMEEDKYNRTTWKEKVSSMILFSEEHMEDLPQGQAEKIEDDVLREILEKDGATLFHKITKNEKSFKWTGGQR